MTDLAQRRAAMRVGLHSLYLPFYDALCKELEHTFWVPTSGFRSMAWQQALYDQGRTPESIARGEKIVTYSQPGQSAHNFGCASDWVEMRPGVPASQVWAKSDWTFYAGTVKKIGATWGGDFNGNGIRDRADTDFPHNQLKIAVPYSAVGQVYRAYGPGEVNKYLERVVVRGR
jgi:hypothetical protein